jgi:hypothetical protein
MNLPVVVEITPLMSEVKTNEFVVVEIVRVLLPMIVEVEVEPPRLEVRVLPRRDKIFETERLLTDKLVILALVSVAVPVAFILPVFKLASCKLPPTASSNSSHCAKNSVTSPKYE